MHFGHVKTKSRTKGANSEYRTDGDGAITVTLSGELDHEGVLDVENDVRWAVANANVCVTVDAENVTFVDSAGLRLILQSQMMAADRHVRFILASPSESLVRLLQLTGLDDLIDTGKIA